MSDFQRLELMFRRAGVLPELSLTCALVKAIDERQASAGELESIIASDPLLAAQLLRAAEHSPFLASEIGDLTIQRMVLMLGTKAVRNMAIALAVNNVIKLKTQSLTFDARRYSDTSLLIGNLSRCIHTRMLQQVEPMEVECGGDEVFAAGSLSYIAHAVLASVLPSTYDQTFRLAKLTSSSFEEAFRKQYASSTYELGAVALETWGLPSLFLESQRNLENPLNSREQSRTIACIRLAQIAVSQADVTEAICYSTWREDPVLSAICPVDKGEISAMLTLLRPAAGAGGVDAVTAQSAKEARRE